MNTDYVPKTPPSSGELANADRIDAKLMDLHQACRDAGMKPAERVVCQERL